jgi:undecaprenyl-diphosphatase
MKAAPAPLHLPPAQVARLLLAAGFIIVAAGLLAGPLVQLLRSDAVAHIDADWPALIHARFGARAMQAMAFLSTLHGTAGILAMAAVLAIALWQGGRSDALPWLVATVPGGLLLNAAVKLAVHRARPDWGYAAQHLSTFSFPSGHTAGATVFYGFVLALAWRRYRSAAARAGLVLAAWAMVLLVATSRIALGMHFPSDCAAALLEGLLWLWACLYGRPHRVPSLTGAETR